MTATSTYLTTEELAELPLGSLIVVYWSGGNWGRYILEERRHGAVLLNTPESHERGFRGMNWLRTVYHDPLLTRAELLSLPEGQQ